MMTLFSLLCKTIIPRLVSEFQKDERTALYAVKRTKVYLLSLIKYTHMGHTPEHLFG